MTNKQRFIQEVSAFTSMMTPEAVKYFEELSKEKEKFTTNGAKIIKFLQEKGNENKVFKAKEIGEALFISSRSVSGSMKKLVTDGYVEKLDKNPISYRLTLLGTEVQVDN